MLPKPYQTCAAWCPTQHGIALPSEETSTQCPQNTSICFTLGPMQTSEMYIAEPSGKVRQNSQGSAVLVCRS